MPANESPAAQPSTDLALIERLDRALPRVAESPELLRRGRWLNSRCLIQVGSEQVVLTFSNGRPGALSQASRFADWEFALRASAQTWTEYWRPIPKAGCHDLMALFKRGELRIEGAWHPLITHLQYFKDLLALPRQDGTQP